MKAKNCLLLTVADYRKMNIISVTLRENTVNEPTILRSKVPPQFNGRSLLDYLSTRFRYQTPETWKTTIAEGQVTVNAKTTQPEQILHTKDIVAYSVILKEPPVNKDIHIIHDEESFLVAYKPPHLPSHADGNYIKNTFVHLINQRLAEQGWTGKAQLVHRLDRETSGLMIVAKVKSAISKLSLQFEKGLVEKEYLAIIRGTLPRPEIEVSGLIAPDTQSNISIRQKLTSSSESDAKSSLTQFKTIKNFGPYSLIECRPKTGRTNQIRIHLDSIGHPIIGDKLYGRTDEQFLAFVHAVKQGANAMALPNLEASRHFLHASRLTFAHPETGKKVTFTSELPDDMAKFIRDHS